MKRMAYWIMAAVFMLFLTVCTVPDMQVPPSYNLHGRHIVFDKKIVKYAEGNISISDFNTWVERLDKVYDAYVDLIGRAPAGGKVLELEIYEGNEINAWGWAYDSNKIGWRHNVVANELKIIAETGSYSFGIMHEIGHLFDYGSKWDADGELTANLKIVYAIENIGAEAYFYDRLNTDDSLRKSWYGWAVDQFNNGDIQPYGDNSVFSMYLYGLVDTAGWDAYKKAFRSYFDASYGCIKETYRTGGDRHVKAREFFDRVQFFSGQPVLNSLPDHSSLLYLAFPVLESKRVSIRNRELKGMECETFTVPDYITEIEEGAFNDCLNLKEIYFPASVVKFGFIIFSGCTQLKDVYIYAKNAEFNDWAFYSFVGNLSFTVHAPAGGSVEAFVTARGFNFSPLP